MKLDVKWTLCFKNLLLCVIFVGMSFLLNGCGAWKPNSRPSDPQKLEWGKLGDRPSSDLFDHYDWVCASAAHYRPEER